METKTYILVKRNTKAAIMNKTVVIGDIHGRTIWRDIIDQEKPDRVIFMGDYFDSFDISGVEQLHNFNEIIRFKEETDIEVIMLYGNHDHHYMGVGETYSGYQPSKQFDFNYVLREAMSKGHIQLAHSVDDLLFTHAGVSSVWLEEHLPETTMETLVQDLNDLLKYQPNAFNFTGFDPYGNSRQSGPIWIRIDALLKSNKNKPIKKTFRQVVGHTQVKKIDLENYAKFLGDRYFMIDALDAGQFLIYQDKEISVGQVQI